MKKYLQYPLIRILIAIVIIGAGIVAGQVVLNLLRYALSITSQGAANLLALVTILPVVSLAYWVFVHYVERREPTEMGGENAIVVALLITFSAGVILL